MHDPWFMDKTTFGAERKFGPESRAISRDTTAFVPLAFQGRRIKWSGIEAGA